MRWRDIDVLGGLCGGCKDNTLDCLSALFRWREGPRDIRKSFVEIHFGLRQLAMVDLARRHR